MSVLERLQNLTFPLTTLEEFDLISEVAYNVLLGNVLLDPIEKLFFITNKPALRTLIWEHDLKTRARALSKNLFKKLREVAIRYLDG